MNLNGSHVVVTGASRGIGAALTRELVRRGAKVTMVARTASALESLVQECGAFSIVADLARNDAAEGLMERIEAQGGPIDVLINNAALGGVGRFLDMPESASRDHINANLLAPMELTRKLLPSMLAHGRGAIVMVSSVAGEIATRNATPYGASKSGLSMFTSNLQRELKGQPVNIMLVVLGEVATSILDAVRADPVMAEIAKKVGKLRAMTPEQVATGIADALERQRSILVLPKPARPILWWRLVPSRIMDFATRGVR